MDKTEKGMGEGWHPGRGGTTEKLGTAKWDGRGERRGWSWAGYAVKRGYSGWADGGRRGLGVEGVILSAAV